jgi:hypothetical protein
MNELDSKNLLRLTLWHVASILKVTAGDIRKWSKKVYPDKNIKGVDITFTLQEMNNIRRNMLRR